LQKIPEYVWETMDLAELFEKGCPPVAGGVMDQTDAFLQAVRMIRSEKARIELEELRE
jgi:hypothetical protein